MRDVCVVLAVLLASFTLTPEVASACSFGASNAYMIWPFPEESDVQNTAPPATDTQIWFIVPHGQYSWDAKLLDPQGQEVSHTLETFTVAGTAFSEYTTHVMLSPDAPLEPETTYTFTSELGEGEFSEPSVAEYTFTTGASADVGQEEGLGELDLFVLDGEQLPDDCGFPGAQRQFTVRVDEQITERPYHYKLELTFPNGQTIENEYFSSARGENESPYRFLSNYVPTNTALPCMKLVRQDVYGNEVSSQEMCEWTCKAHQSDWYSILAEDRDDELAACADSSGTDDMGHTPGQDMDMASPGDDMEPSDMNGQGEDEATCSSAPGARPASAWLVFIGLLLVSLKRKGGRHGDDA